MWGDRGKEVTITHTKKKKKLWSWTWDFSFPFVRTLFPLSQLLIIIFLKIKGRKQHSLSQCRVICSLHRVTGTVAMLVGDKSWDVPACQVKWSLSQGVAGPQKGLGEHSPGHWVMQLWCLGLGRSLHTWMGSTASAEPSSWASLYLQLLHQNKTASLSIWAQNKLRQQDSHPVCSPKGTGGTLSPRQTSWHWFYAEAVPG